MNNIEGVIIIRNSNSGFASLRLTSTVLAPLAALFIVIAGGMLSTGTGDENQGLSTQITRLESAQLQTMQKAKVSRVVDGDTIIINSGPRVRLIGIDTPESVNPDKSKNTELGKKASAYTKKMLSGKTVYLEKDISETDKYGRLLRYVYLDDGTFFNELLVIEGMANPYTYPPDIKYADLFVKAGQYARENSKGLWAKK